MVSSAFVPCTPLTAMRSSHTMASRMTFSSRPTTTTTTTVMSVTPRKQNRTARLSAFAASSIPASLITTLPAFASEGTGEGLGIDTPFFSSLSFLSPLFSFVFFLQFGRSQTNDDFTGEYDERRN